MIKLAISFGAFLLCGSISFASDSNTYLYQGKTYYNPIQKFSQGELQQSPPSSEGDFSIERDLSPQILHVLIFPHLGPYPMPQGKETVLDQLTLRSDQLCTLSDLASGAILAIKNIFKIKASDLASPVRVHCETPATLIRDLNLKQIAYNGDFIIKSLKNSTGALQLQVVLELSLDEYLRGVVPAEMPASWPMESLKAQAIAARTYALYELSQPQLHPINPDYDFDDTVEYQAFLGLYKADPQTDLAVKDTSGIRMTFGGKIIKAYFSADSGGYTEAPINVWKVSYPYCISKPEVYDLNLINSEWTISKNIFDLQNELKNLIPSGKLIKDIQVTQRSQSHRAIGIKISFTDQSAVDLWGPDFQFPLVLKSTLFEVENIGGEFKFKGRGYGHGVGMNQTGTKVLAESKGWNADKILNFYYRP